jgi:protein phosphatase
MRITCAAGTDAGRVRSVNDDTYRMMADRGLFLVADGVSGSAPCAASDVAARVILQRMGRLTGVPILETTRRLREAIRQANAVLFERSHRSLVRRQTGTTATVLVLRPGTFLIGHVGNSRAYLFREGTLIQLTIDHTFVQAQIDAGLLTLEQAREHPWRKVITRCVGVRDEVTPDIVVGAVQSGDILLIASDGLTRMLDDDDIAAVLSSEGGPPQWVRRMIQAANDRGGLDNITAVAVRVDSVGEPSHHDEATSPLQISRSA